MELSARRTQHTGRPGALWRGRWPRRHRPWPRCAASHLVSVRCISFRNRRHRSLNERQHVYGTEAIRTRERRLPSKQLGPRQRHNLRTGTAAHELAASPNRPPALMPTAGRPNWPRFGTGRPRCPAGLAALRRKPVHARTHSASDPLEAAPATLDAKSRHDYPRIFTGQHARRAPTWPAMRPSGATVALHRRRG